MPITKKHLAILALPALLGLGAAGTAVGAGRSDAGDGPVRCEIAASSSGGMITLEGIVHTDVNVSGSYTLRIESSGPAGRSSTSQGGAFSAKAGESVALSKVMLGRNGATYKADLEVDANGMHIECSERLTSAI